MKTNWGKNVSLRPGKKRELFTCMNSASSARRIGAAEKKKEKKKKLRGKSRGKNCKRCYWLGKKCESYLCIHVHLQVLMENVKKKTRGKKKNNDKWCKW